MNGVKEGFKQLMEGLKARKEQMTSTGLMGAVSFYLPSLFLIVLGLVALFNPALLGVIVASIFLFFGFLFAVVTWRVLQWKKRVEAAFKQFGGQFVVQTYAMPKEDDVIRPRRSADDKKIIIH